MGIIRRLIETYQLNRNLKRHKAIREARAEAAMRGVSTEWKRRREQCRKVFEGLPADTL